jgi:hypothetical protein
MIVMSGIERMRSEGEIMRVKSENLYSIDYYGGDLYASFNSNPSMLYKYYAVSQDTCNSIINAPSVGQAFNQLIMKAIKPYQFIRRQMVITGTNTDTGEPIYALPEEVPVQEEEETAMEEFEDVIKLLESKGLAKREQDEQGNPRVTFTGQYAIELAEYYKRKGKV